ncbi:hypothetical protein H5410_048015 [Solanum commersonii]|uniref:Uncharacterized protein n=1 Tax=Solanum commersonii TaxID=4109 RepID=A0A9J5XIL0_SOLCO|nr:hypothetical protein H5410_048015 [Solanum commersonii]
MLGHFLLTIIKPKTHSLFVFQFNRAQLPIPSPITNITIQHQHTYNTQNNPEARQYRPPSRPNPATRSDLCSLLISTLTTLYAAVQNVKAAAIERRNPRKRQASTLTKSFQPCQPHPIDLVAMIWRHVDRKGGGFDQSRSHSLFAICGQVRVVVKSLLALGPSLLPEIVNILYDLGSKA